MAEPSDNVIWLPGAGPWVVGQRIIVNHVTATNPQDRYASQFVATVQDCIGLGGGKPAPFVGELGRFVGRIALILANPGDFAPGQALYFAVGAGWSSCCTSRVAFGRYVVPATPAPACVELVQVDGLAHQSIEVLASLGVAVAAASAPRASWRLALIECCGANRQVTAGDGVELNVLPPA